MDELTAVQEPIDYPKHVLDTFRTSPTEHTIKGLSIDEHVTNELVL